MPSVEMVPLTKDLSGWIGPATRSLVAGCLRVPLTMFQSPLISTLRWPCPHLWDRFWPLRSVGRRDWRGGDTIRTVSRISSRDPRPCESRAKGCACGSNGWMLPAETCAWFLAVVIGRGGSDFAPAFASSFRFWFSTFVVMSDFVFIWLCGYCSYFLWDGCVWCWGYALMIPEAAFT